MKQLLTAMFIITAISAMGQQYNGDSDLNAIKLLYKGKDTTYKDTVPAKVRLFINDSTIKTVNGYHLYYTFTHKRDSYWGTYRKPTFSDGYLADDKLGFYKKYPNAIVVQVQDLAEPKYYKLYKYEEQNILNNF